MNPTQADFAAARSVLVQITGVAIDYLDPRNVERVAEVIASHMAEERTARDLSKDVKTC